MKPKTYIYGKNPKHSLDVYSTRRSNGNKVIIFWHGGSWQRSDKNQYRFMGKTLARLGYTVVVPNYRLYPEVKFPKFVEDGALAIKWAVSKFPDSKIVLMGHSAGAHIAALLTFDSKYIRREGLNSDRIGGFIGVSGPYNFYLGPELAKIFEGSPKSEWNPYDKVLKPKPTMLIYGERDKVVLTSNSEDMYQKLRKLRGNPQILEFPLLGHISILFPFKVGLIGFSGLKSKLTKFINEIQ